MTEALLDLVRDGAVGAPAAARASAPSTAWHDANWRYLVAAVRRLAYVLQCHVGMAGEAARDVEAEREVEADVEAELAAARRALPEPSALDQLQARFGLSAFEREVVLLCAAFALDPRLVARYGAPTLALALAVGRALPGEGSAHVVAPGAQAMAPDAPGDALASGTRMHWGVLAPGEALDQIC